MKTYYSQVNTSKMRDIDKIKLFLTLYFLSVTEPEEGVKNLSEKEVVFISYLILNGYKLKSELLKEISEKENIKMNYLYKLIHSLKEKNWLVASRKDGGTVYNLEGEIFENLKEYLIDNKSSKYFLTIEFNNG